MKETDHVLSCSFNLCVCRQGSTLRPAPPRPVLMRRSLLTLAGVILHQMRSSQMQGRAKYKMQILRKGNLQKALGKLHNFQSVSFCFLLLFFFFSVYCFYIANALRRAHFQQDTREKLGCVSLRVPFLICLSCLMSSYLIYSASLIWAGGCIEEEQWFTGEQDIHREARYPVQQNSSALGVGALALKHCK